MSSCAYTSRVPRRRHHQIALTAVVLLVGLSSGGARADEDDWQVAARAGLAGVVADGRSPLGFGLGGDVQYGLDDAWAVRLSLAGAGQSVDADKEHMLPGGTMWSYAAFAGLGYTMDVLRLLPTFEAGLGILGVRGAVKKNQLAVGVQIGLGADYLLTPRFSVGLTAQYVFAPFDLFSHVLTGEQTPQAFAFCTRATWILR